MCDSINVNMKIMVQIAFGMCCVIAVSNGLPVKDINLVQFNGAVPQSTEELNSITSPGSTKRIARRAFRDYDIDETDFGYPYIYDKVPSYYGNSYDGSSDSNYGYVRNSNPNYGYVRNSNPNYGNVGNSNPNTGYVRIPSPNYRFDGGSNRLYASRRQANRRSGRRALHSDTFEAFRSAIAFG